MPQTTTICLRCSTPFSIAPEDEAFYKRMGVPHPTLCPPCRERRRMAWRNERNLYRRTCDLCHKPIIAVLPQKTPYTIYCNDCWWGDAWSQFDYTQEPNFKTPFFPQFSKLEKAIPHIALHQDGTSENCEYTNYGISSKNCYMTIPVFCEDVYYGSANMKCKSCIDCMKCIGSELCYECVDCITSYNLHFSKDCSNCRDSSFLEDCTSCTNCFCCAGLRHKDYCFENKQLSEKEYINRIGSIKFTATSIAQYREKLTPLAQAQPKIYIHGSQNENVTGDYLDNCKNVKQCFDCPALEDSAYSSFSGGGAKDVYDCLNFGMNSELCYEINGATFYNNCVAVYYGRTNHDLKYCHYCFNCDHCFGCIGLRHKRFCILNRQYEPAEYTSLEARLIAHMRETKEYGEFFPAELSPYPYEESVAQDYYPN